MRFAQPHNPRRGAFLFIALFSCLQITLGFFLFTGKGQESVLPINMASAAHEINQIEPAAGNENAYYSNDESPYYSGNDHFDVIEKHTPPRDHPFFVNYQVE